MKESEVKPFLNLYFFHKNYINVTGLKFDFQKDIQYIKNIKNNKCTIEIPELFFKYGKDKRAVTYKVFGGESNKNLGERNMYLYYGENNAFFQLDHFGLTFEYIFKSNNLNLENENGTIRFDKFDTFDTKDRRRLVLLNYSDYYIRINGTSYDIHSDIIYKSIKEVRNNWSFQITEINHIKKDFLLKEIIDFPEINFKDLTGEKNTLNNFINSIENMLSMNNEEYNNQYNKIKIQFMDLLKIRKIVKFLDLNGPKLYIKDRMDKDESLDLEIYWKVNLYVYFMEKKTMSQNKIFFQKLYEKSLEVKNKLHNDKNLNLFQKIYILNNFFYLFKSCKSLDSLNNINIRYYFFSKRKQNSILNKVKKFFCEFINSLTENSFIFPYILKVDAGCGFYKRDKIFTYDMQNIKMIKSHLNQIFPEILFFYYKKNDTMASTSPQGAISINEYQLLKHDKKKYIGKINYEEDLNDNILSSNIAMDIILDFFHEYTGHKKFSDFEYYDDSPKKYFDDSGNFFELMPISHKSKKQKDDKDDKNDDNIVNKEYILSSSLKKGEGESGHFIELSFGKIGNKYVFDEIYKIKNKDILLIFLLKHLWINQFYLPNHLYVSQKRNSEKENKENKNKMKKLI